MLGDKHAFELTAVCRNLGEAAEPRARWIGGAIHFVADEISSCASLEWEEDGKLFYVHICECFPSCK